MNEQAIFEALDRARRGLRDCLGELEASSPQDPNVGSHFSEVRSAFELLGDLRALRERVGPKAQTQLQERFAELLRLNALLSQAVQADRMRIVGLLHQSRQGLRTMDAISESNAPSTTCDVSA